MAQSTKTFAPTITFEPKLQEYEQVLQEVLAYLRWHPNQGPPPHGLATEEDVRQRILEVLPHA